MFAFVVTTTTVGIEADATAEGCWSVIGGGVAIANQDLKKIF